MDEFIVSSRAAIKSRGLALLFENDPPPLKIGHRVSIRVDRPDGHSLVTAAMTEAARRVPPGEVAALVLPDATEADVPVGSRVRILDWDTKPSGGPHAHIPLAERRLAQWLPGLGGRTPQRT